MLLNTCHKLAQIMDTDLAHFVKVEKSIEQQTKGIDVNDATNASGYLLTVGMDN